LPGRAHCLCDLRRTSRCACSGPGGCWKLLSQARGLIALNCRKVAWRLGIGFGSRRPVPLQCIAARSALRAPRCRCRRIDLSILIRNHFRCRRRRQLLQCRLPRRRLPRGLLPRRGLPQRGLPHCRLPHRRLPHRRLHHYWLRHGDRRRRSRGIKALICESRCSSVGLCAGTIGEQRRERVSCALVPGSGAIVARRGARSSARSGARNCRSCCYRGACGLSHRRVRAAGESGLKHVFKFARIPVRGARTRRHAAIGGRERRRASRHGQGFNHGLSCQRAG